MTILKTLLSNDYRLNTGREFVDSLSDDRYFVYIGNHVANNTVIASDMKNNANDTNYYVYRNMLYGKLITNNNVVLAVNNKTWTTNTVYDIYNDQKIDVLSTQFYAITHSGSTYYVFKCLENGGGQPSTVAPNYAEIDSADKVYITSDGYVWKYLFKVSDSTYNTFATQTLFPVVVDANVESRAISGTIDAFVVSDPGAGYQNYFSGTFTSTDVRVTGNTVLYRLRGDVNTTNTFYNGCYLYITAGSGTGEYRLIDNYFSNSTASYVVIDTPFLTPPQNGSVYEVTPAVVITGNGNETINAAARAVVNAVTNTIFRVEVLDTGADYELATASVLAANAVGVTAQANVRPVLAPPGGHGSDPASELGAKSVIVSVSFTNTISNTVVGGRYSQLGIVRNPLFANVELTVNPTGTFTSNETIYGTTEVYNFVITSGTGSTTINTSSTALTRLSNTSWARIDSSNNRNSATVVSFGANTLVVTNAAGEFNTNQIVWGGSSNASANVVAVRRNGQAKPLDSFVQLYKYTVNMTSSPFGNNEIVTQGSSSAHVHSANSTVVYLTNKIGDFALNTPITGTTSGAVGEFTSETLPELVFGSGKVLYIENFDYVTRDPSQTETFKLVLSF